MNPHEYGMTRAKHRLFIAARLLDIPHDADVMAEIGQLPNDQQERLRGHVDFVEAYELAEEA